jgi:hypothetical protein
MRRRDKLTNMKRVNKLFESRNLAEYGNGGMSYDTEFDGGQEGEVDPSLTGLPGYDKIMLYPKQFQQWVYEDDSWAITYVHKQGIKDIPELFAFWKREGFDEPHPNDDGKTYDQAQGETHGY